MDMLIQIVDTQLGGYQCYKDVFENEEVKNSSLNEPNLGCFVITSPTQSTQHGGNSTCCSFV